MIEFNATFIVSMISFVVFIFVMNMIFYKPVLNIMRKRNEYISDNYEVAKDFSSKAEFCMAEINSAVEKEKIKSRDEAKAAIDKARKNAIDKINTNRVAANKKIQSGKEALYNDANILKKEIDETVIGDLTENLTEKILKGAL